MRVWVETKVGWVAGDVGYGRIKQAYVGASCQRVPCRPMTMRLTCAVPHADPCAMLILALRDPRACTGRFPGRRAAAHAGPVDLGCRRKRRYVNIVGCWRKDYFLQHPFGIRQRPTLPGRLQPSTISAWRLNCCVRYGNRWDPPAIATGNRMTFSGDALVLGLGLSVDRLRFSSASNVRILKTAQEK